MNVVVVGHVDHGKSTVIGRLLSDTGTLPEGKIEQIRELCSRTSKPFEYAFILDALKEERAQGITVDSARVFFRSAKREYMIIDAPGHVEFLKNLVTGAAVAEAAVLVIDAHEGIRENSRRHGQLLALLGIREIIVVVNKMDLVEYDARVFESIVKEYAAFLETIGISARQFIPAVALEGIGLAGDFAQMPWFQGANLLSTLDELPAAAELERRPLRMPVQDVYKFTGNGDDRRIIAGTIESGRLRSGDDVVFHPSGRTARVRSLEGAEAGTAFRAGDAAGLTLTEPVFVQRGELLSRVGEPAPLTGKSFLASVFWLGRQPLRKNRDYIFKLGAAKISGRLREIRRVIDSAKLEMRKACETLNAGEAGECVFDLKESIAFDLPGVAPGTGRFVIVDEREIAGGGTVTGNADARTAIDGNGLDRAQAYGQTAGVIFIRTKHETGDTSVAKAIETQLFQNGRVVCFADYRDHDAESFERLVRTILNSGLLLITAMGNVSDFEMTEIRARLAGRRTTVIDLRDESSIEVRELVARLDTFIS